VRCPNSVTVTIRRGRDGDGAAYFAKACSTCPCGPSAPTPPPVAPSASAATRRRWPALVSAKRTMTGARTTERLSRRSNASSRTRAPQARRRMTRVRGTNRVDADFRLLAAQPTWRAWRCSGFARRRVDGRLHERSAAISGRSSHQCPPHRPRLQQRQHLEHWPQSARRSAHDPFIPAGNWSFDTGHLGKDKPPNVTQPKRDHGGSKT
jgi:hypothetical protein